MNTTTAPPKTDQDSLLQRRASIELSPVQFTFFKQLLLEKTGIHLNETKTGLVEGRVHKRLKALGLESFEDYINHLENDKTSQEVKLFINCLTTNKTSFFRERVQIDYLSDLCEEHYSSQTVYIWSAACSTGEEIYSLAIMLEDLKYKYPKFDYRILGTDIDTNCISKATKASYPKSISSSLNPYQVNKYFIKDNTGAHELLTVSEEIRNNIKIREHNITNFSDNIPMKFHFIFLRNVMIYFSGKTIDKVSHKMDRHLHRNGLLFIGLTESLRNTSTKLKSLGNCIYHKEE